MYFLTCHGPEIIRLVDGREVDTDLRDLYVVFLDQVRGGLCISIDSSKKLVELICNGFQIFQINLPFLAFERERAINYLSLRTQIFLMQSRFLEGMVCLSFKKGFSQPSCAILFY